MRTMTKHALTVIAGCLLTVASSACDDEETGESTAGSTSHHHGDHGTHDHESSGTTEHGTTAHDDSTTAHDDHGTTETGQTESGSTGDSTTTDGYVPPSAEAYCTCMLDACHDLYHSTWGEDHVESEMMCMASFEASPVAGMPAMEGNSRECRAYHCEAAANDEALCESAMGGGTCR